MLRSLLYIILALCAISCDQQEMTFDCTDIDFEFIRKPTSEKSAFEMSDFEIKIKEGYIKDELSYNVQAWQMTFNHCFRLGTYIKSEMNKVEYSENALFLKENSMIPGIPVKYHITISCKNGKIWERVLVFS